MIGHAPFLGQVHLLGQGSWDDEPAFSNRMDRAIQAHNDILKATDLLPDEIAGLVQARMSSIWRRCQGLLGVRYDPARVMQSVVEAENCVNEEKAAYDAAVREAYAIARGQPVGSAQPEIKAEVKAEAGVPTWAWVVGGLAAAGLVAFVATR